jgi:hypothetical protein
LQERHALVGRFLGQQVLDILSADHPGLGDEPANGVKRKKRAADLLPAP